MNEIIDTLRKDISENISLMLQLNAKLHNAEAEIANGGVPEVAPSRILATIEYCQGYHTALSKAVRLMIGEDI